MYFKGLIPALWVQCDEIDALYLWYSTLIPYQISGDQVQKLIKDAATHISNTAIGFHFLKFHKTIYTKQK